jgi:hypothetical protein
MGDNVFTVPRGKSAQSNLVPDEGSIIALAVLLAVVGIDKSRQVIVRMGADGSQE